MIVIIRSLRVGSDHPAHVPGHRSGDNLAGAWRGAEQRLEDTQAQVILLKRIVAERDRRIADLVGIVKPH